MRVDQLERQVAIGQVVLDPVGEVVLYTRRTVVGARDRIDLWTVPFAGGQPRQLTDGPSWDVGPAFSPDGTLIAFLSGVPGTDSQVHVMGRDGGAPRRVTDFPHGAEEFAWAPDGQALVVLAEDERMPGEVPAEGDDEPTARVIERVDWRRDAEGTSIRRPRHVHRVPLEGGGAERLTEGAWSASNVRVADDGTVLFLADLLPGGDLEPIPQIHRPGAGGRPEAVTDLPGGVGRFAPEANGEIFCLGWPEALRLDEDPPQPFRVELGGATTALGPPLDRYAGEFAVDTDLHDWCTDLDDAGPVTGVVDSGCVIPMRLGEGGAEPLVPTELLPQSGAIAADGERVVAVMMLGAGVHAPEVYALEPAGPRQLTTHGSDWLDGLTLPDVEVIEIDGPAGPMRTTLVAPPGAADGPLATVLLPHGGPTGQWGTVPPLEAALLAGAGYLVALPNIRGSYDRGKDWVAALAGRWGEVDAEDCHAVLDHLVAAGRADPQRLGCTGLSYGGYLVQWLIGASDRFRAAVAENGVANLISAWANCDQGPLLNRMDSLPDPTSPEGAEALWRMSPLSHVADIHTPLLMLQGEDDQICPAADNEQLFIALRKLGREVEHVRYPGEHHPYQGNGRFDRRLDRHRRVLEWFGRHMPA